MKEPDDLSPEELEAQERRSLPDREVMSLLRVLPDGSPTYEPVLPEQASGPAPDPIPAVEES